MRPISHLIILVALLVLTATARAAIPTTKPASPFRQITFTERSPQSALDPLLARMNVNLYANLKPTDAEATKAFWQYDLKKHTFDVAIPPAYKRDNPHGLLVWMGNTPVSPDWLDILAQHKLILISPTDGNSRVNAVHAGLALDAVHNMRKRFTISKDRVYVAGFSGGAQRAAWLLRAYPDIFHGGVFMMGGWFYHIEVDYDRWFFEPPTEPATAPTTAPTTAPAWQYSARTQTLDPQWKGQIEKLKPQIRIVLVRGEIDDWFSTSIGSERAQYEGLRLDGFTRAQYLEIPGVAHVAPNPQWFEKSLAALEANPNPPPTTAPTTDPNPHPDQIAQARRLLSTAQHGINMRPILQQLLKNYPTTPSAPLAKRGLDYLDRTEKPKPKR